MLGFHSLKLKHASVSHEIGQIIQFKNDFKDTNTINIVRKSSFRIQSSEDEAKKLLIGSSCLSINVATPLRQLSR